MKSYAEPISYCTLTDNYTSSVGIEHVVNQLEANTDATITLTYYRTLPENAENPEHMQFYEELEKRTGIALTFIDVPEDVQLQKLMLMMAAGEAPDLIDFPWKRHSGLLNNLADLGAIIALDELIEKTAPNLNAIFQSNRDVKRQVTSDDGHIYQIPGIDLSDNLVTKGLVIRADLLNKYRLTIPETIDEWEEMLTVFNDNDPSINPLSFDMSIFRGSDSFISAFGIPLDFGVKDGKVLYGPIEDAYKDFLITFNRWYVSGLIDPEFLVLRNSQLTDKVNSGKVGAFISSVDSLENSMDALKTIDSSIELIPVQNPFLNNTDMLNTASGVSMISECGIAISSRNKYPEQSMKWIDYAFSEEGHRLYNDEGSSSFSPELGYQTNESIKNRYLYQEQNKAVQIWSDNNGVYNSSCMPPISLTQEESRELSVVMNDLSVYKDEMFAKYVVGADSLESFAQYVQTAKRLGVEHAIDVMQVALDRYNRRLPVLIVNGKIMDIDTEPVIMDENKMLLPIRFVVEGLGGNVAWDGNKKVVTTIYNDTVITLKLNGSAVMINYETKPLNAEVRAINKRTYVPADFLQDTLNINIEWDENTRAVTVTNKGN